MKKLILTIIVYCSLLIVNSSAQTLTYEKVFHDAQAYSVVKTTDSHFLLAGATSGNEALVIKMDSAGNIIWSKQIGNGGNARFNDIVTMHDSCYFITGQCYNTNNFTLDVFYMKINANGDTLWSKSIDLGFNETAFRAQQTIDHGFIIAGYIAYSTQPYSKMLIMKLDSAGNLSWSKILYSGNSANYAYAVKQTTDSAYVAIGYTEDYPPYTYGTCLFKLSPAGAVVWAQKISNTSGADVIVEDDGFSCLLFSNYNNFTLLKTDFSGNEILHKSYSLYSGGIGGAFPAPSMLATSDNGYAFVTISQYGMPASPTQMVKLDSVADMMLVRDLNQSAMEVIESGDNGYMIAGNGPLMGVKKDKSYEPQIGIIKTDSLASTSTCIWPSSITVLTDTLNFSSVTFTLATGGVTHVLHPVIISVATAITSGCVDMTGDVLETSADINVVQLFPNPTDGKFEVKSIKLKVERIEVYNSLGARIKTILNTNEIDISDEADGIYIVKVKTGEDMYVSKLIKQ